jgi:nitroreductase
VARALDLDPQCGKAWWVRSWIESNRPKADPEAILDFTLRAARYAPNEASTYVAIACEAPTSNFAVTAGKRAIELDPLDPGGYFVTAFSLALAGRAEEGLSFAERGLWLGAAKEELTWAKFLCLFHAGHYAEARRVIPVAQSSEPVRLMHFIMDGDRDGGRAYAKALVAKWRQVESGAEDWVNRRGFCGPLFLRLGMHAELLWLLEKSTDAGGPPSLEWFFENSEAGQLHDDPRFKRAFQASRAHGRLFLRLADAARARGEYPGPLEVPLAELRALLERHPAF